MMKFRDKAIVQPLRDFPGIERMPIKGRTKIEMFDALTGKLTDRIVHDNMFTNAIGMMANHALRHDFVHYRSSGATGGLNSLLDSHLDLVSGILMFDEALDSDPDNIWAPASANLVACGATGKINGDANVPMMGSYNAAESYSSGLVRRWVFDFLTNQGNGSIATVCLTSNRGGYIGYGSPNQMGSSALFASGTQPYNGISLGNIMDRCKYGGYWGESSENYNYCKRGNGFVPFCIDDENDLAYAYRVRADGYLEICSYKMTPSKFDIFRAVTTLHDGTVEEYAASFTMNYYWHFYNTDEKCLYFWGRSDRTTNAVNETWTINKFDMQSKTLTTNYDSVTLSNQYYLDPRNVAITANAIYSQQGSSGNYNVILKHTRGGASGFTVISLGTSFNNGYQSLGAFVLNGWIYLGMRLYASQSNAARQVMVRVSDDAVRYNGLNVSLGSANYGMNPRIVPPYNNKQMVFGTGQQMGYYGTNLYSMDGTEVSSSSNYRGGGNTFTLSNYLATKNVLPAVATKDATKTMKVTYEITGQELE